jgi:hypothetical protein
LFRFFRLCASPNRQQGQGRCDGQRAHAPHASLPDISAF